MRFYRFKAGQEKKDFFSKLSIVRSVAINVQRFLYRDYAFNLQFVTTSAINNVSQKRDNQNYIIGLIALCIDQRRICVIPVSKKPYSKVISAITESTTYTFILFQWDEIFSHESLTVQTRIFIYIYAQ